MLLTASIGCFLLQAIWVVDDNGGPGVNFTDIPPAITAAADGDILLVKAGIYSPFTVSAKGLRILGEDENTTLVQPPPLSTVFVTVVTNLPPNAVVWIEHLTLTSPSPFFTHRLIVSGTTTRAVLSNVVVEPVLGGGLASAAVEPAVLVDGSEAHLLHCAVTGNRGAGCGGFPLCTTIPGGPGLGIVNGGRAHVASSTITGGIGGSGYSLGMSFLPGEGGPGVSLTSSAGTLSRLWIADSAVNGGDGGVNSGTLKGGGGGPGITLADSIARISGSLVRGGNSSPFTFCTGVALGGTGILASGASVVNLHGVTVLGGNGCNSAPGSAPSTSGTGFNTNLPPLPVLHLAGGLALSGGSATFTISNGPPGAPFGIVIDDGPAYFGIPGPFLGEFLVGPPPFTLFLFGALSPAGNFSATFPLGGLPPSLAYLPFHFQAAALDPGSGTWRLSNAAVAILRP